MIELRSLKPQTHHWHWRLAATSLGFTRRWATAWRALASNRLPYRIIILSRLRLPCPTTSIGDQSVHQNRSIHVLRRHPQHRYRAMGAVGQRGRPPGPLETVLLVLAAWLAVTIPGTTAIGASTRPTALSMLTLQRLARVRGGSTSAGGGPSFFPVFPPASTVPVQPLKSGSVRPRGSGSTTGSSTESGLWGSHHFDDRWVEASG